MKTKGPAIQGETARWKPLLEWTAAELFRGTVFRCLAAKWPYESVVDFMLVEHSESPSGLSIMVVTGYKAGLTLVHLPAEVKPPGGSRAVSTQWMVGNWSKWIYPECPVDRVQVIGNYPAEVRVDGTPPSASRDLRIE